jgi:hypothetical protein
MIANGGPETRTCLLPDTKRKFEVRTAPFARPLMTELHEALHEEEAQFKMMQQELTEVKEFRVHSNDTTLLMTRTAQTPRDAQGH